MSEQVQNLSRRSFLKAVPTAAAALAVGVYLEGPMSAFGETPTQLAPNAWVAIDRQGKVLIWCARVEVGQGVRTSLPAIVADELGADWKSVEVVPAAFNTKYGSQMVGGSASIRTSWDMLRKAGATAREMLIEAYCRKTGATRQDCRTEDGFVIHSSGKRMSFGELVEMAATLAAPQNAPLKDKKDFKYIGKSLKRIDSLPKLTGEAKFVSDLRPVPGMLFASVVHCPVHGGSVKSFDGAAALKLPGVKHVVKAAPDAVAVVADSTWAALRGREAVKVTWDDGPHVEESEATLRAQFEKATLAPQKRARNDGDVDAALRTGPVLEAVYSAPFIAHAPLETPDAIVWVQKDRCDVWMGAQDPETQEAYVKEATKLPSSAIHFNIPLAGGGFGRRAFFPELREAVEISKQIGAPVQVMWTRADDLQNDYYRPASYHRLSASIGPDGLPTAWWHRISSTPIITCFNPQAPPEALELGGARDVPYTIPNLRVEYAPATTALMRGWLRSVAHSFNAWVVESFLDELAVAAKRDPLEYRMALLEKAPKQSRRDPERLRGVLSLVAEKSGWGKRKLGPGRGMGIAAHHSFNTYAAQVAEVAVDKNGNVKVERITCAVDCGQVINPVGVQQQVEGGIALALSAALKGRISVKNGAVEQTNWSDYDILRFSEMPEVETYTVESDLPPTGLGEPAFPPVAPAVANAIFAATGKRVRELPLKL